MRASTGVRIPTQVPQLGPHLNLLDHPAMTTRINQQNLDAFALSRPCKAALANLGCILAPRTTLPQSLASSWQGIVTTCHITCAQLPRLVPFLQTQSQVCSCMEMLSELTNSTAPFSSQELPLLEAPNCSLHLPRTTGWPPAATSTRTWPPATMHTTASGKQDSCCRYSFALNKTPISTKNI